MSTINVQIHLSRGNFYHKLELHKSPAEALPAPTILHDFQKHISSLVSADVQVEIIIKVRSIFIFMLPLTVIDHV